MLHLSQVQGLPLRNRSSIYSPPLPKIPQGVPWDQRLTSSNKAELREYEEETGIELR